MLDPRVRSALVDFEAGRSDLEATAQRLLTVRRETGCLSLQVSATSSQAQRALVERYQLLVQKEFGTDR